MTTSYTDERMMDLVGRILHAFHFDIVSIILALSVTCTFQAESIVLKIDDGELYEIDWMLPYARAVRDVSAILFRLASRGCIAAVLTDVDDVVADVSEGSGSALG